MELQTKSASAARRSGQHAAIDRRVVGAWERFVAGEDQIEGVRPEILMSWYRCRERYQVDPGLAYAPTAPSRSEHSLDHDVVFTELGGAAASIGREVEGRNGVVTVADATGRILASWGDRATLARAKESNLAPWSCWAEWASGTNGMGTALEVRGPTAIRGAEHWCEGFHDWACAGQTIRDIVTDDPVAILNISCWCSALHGSLVDMMSKAVERAHAKLYERAHNTGGELVAAFMEARARSGGGLAALDASGKVAIADDEASVLLGVPARHPAVSPGSRWDCGLPELGRMARYAAEQAHRDPDWVGATQIFTHLAREPIPISIKPVLSAQQMVGMLVTLGSVEGEQLGNRSTERAHAVPRRIVGVHGERLVLLRLPEVAYAESDGDVWLTTDQGRVQSAMQGLEKLERELVGGGFLRVHRRFLVNLARVREIERGFKGELLLVLDVRDGEAVPVSRRNAPAVRRALGI